MCQDARFYYPNFSKILKYHGYLLNQRHIERLQIQSALLTFSFQKYKYTNRCKIGVLAQNTGFTTVLLGSCSQA